MRNDLSPGDHSSIEDQVYVYAWDTMHKSTNKSKDNLSLSNSETHFCYACGSVTDSL